MAEELRFPTVEELNSGSLSPNRNIGGSFKGDRDSSSGLVFPTTEEFNAFDLGVEKKTGWKSFLVKGFHDAFDMVNITKAGFGAYSGAADVDEEELIQRLSSLSEREQEYQKSQQHIYFQSVIEKEGKDADEAKGFVDTSLAYLDMLGKGLWAGVTNPQGFAEFTASQVGNQAASLVPMIAGFISPIPGGAYAGMAAGEMAVETGGAVLEALHHRGINVLDKAALREAIYDPEVMSDLYKEGLIKAGIIAASGFVGMGAGSWILKGPSRRLAKDLAKAGITDDLAKGGLMKALIAEQAGDKAVKAALKKYAGSVTGKKALARGAGATVAEISSEGFGEGFGQLGAFGEVNAADVGLEMLGAIGQSAVQTSLIKGLGGIKDVANRQKIRREQARLVAEGESSGIKPEDINSALQGKRDAVGGVMDENPSIILQWEEVIAESDNAESVADTIRSVSSYKELPQYRQILHAALQKEGGFKDVVPIFLALSKGEQATLIAGGDIGRPVKGSLSHKNVRALSGRKNNKGEVVGGQNVVLVKVPITSVIMRGNWKNVELVVDSKGMQLAAVPQATPKAETQSTLATKLQAEANALARQDVEKVLQREVEIGELESQAAERAKKEVETDVREAQNKAANKLAQLREEENYENVGALQAALDRNKIPVFPGQRKKRPPLALALQNYRKALQKPDSIDLINSVLAPTGYKLTHKKDGVHIVPIEDKPALRVSHTGNREVGQSTVDDYLFWINEEKSQKKPETTERKQKTLRDEAEREETRKPPRENVQEIIDSIESNFVTREGDTVTIDEDGLTDILAQTENITTWSQTDRKRLDQYVKSVRREQSLETKPKKAPVKGTTITVPQSAGALASLESSFKRTGKAKFIERVRKLLTNKKGNDALLEQIAKAYRKANPGKVEGDIASILTLTGKADQADIAKVYALANMLITLRNSVSTIRPDNSLAIEDGNLSAFMRFDKVLGGVQENQLVGQIKQAFGEDATYTRINDFEVVVTNPKLTPIQFARRFGRLRGKRNDIRKSELFTAQIETHTHDWAKDPLGESIRSEIRRLGFDNILKYVDDRRADYLDIAEEFGAKEVAQYRQAPRAPPQETATEEDTESTDEVDFSLEGKTPGVNINDSSQPFTEQILSGEKTIETRDTDSLRPYVGKRVGIVRTGKGKATLVGYATIGKPTVYRTEEGFRVDERKHLIEKGSPFDIEDTKYGYPLTDVTRVSPQDVTTKGIVAREVPAENTVQTIESQIRDIEAQIAELDPESESGLIEELIFQRNFLLEEEGVAFSLAETTKVYPGEYELTASDGTKYKVVQAEAEETFGPGREWKLYRATKENPDYHADFDWDWMDTFPRLKDAKAWVDGQEGVAFSLDQEAPLAFEGVDPDDIRLGVAVKLTPEQNKKVKELKNEFPSLAKMLSYLTPSEKAKVYRNILQSQEKKTEEKKNEWLKKALTIFEHIPSDKEYAAVAFAGRAKKGWYLNSAKALIAVFGVNDAPRFASLLAALSPQTSVEMNLENTLKVWTAWIKDGRPSDEKSIITILARSVRGANIQPVTIKGVRKPGKGKPGLATMFGRAEKEFNDTVTYKGIPIRAEKQDVPNKDEKAWVFVGGAETLSVPELREATNGLLEKTVKELSVLEAWQNNTIRALDTSVHPTEILLSGPKVDSFMWNLRGFVNEITSDTHMANFAFMRQTMFGGKITITDPGKGPGYLAANSAMRSAAKILTKQTGEVWTPAEIQETIWSWVKVLSEKREAAGENREVIELANELSAEDIDSADSFADLFAQTVYRKILEGVPEYAESVRQLDESVERDSGGVDQRGRPASPEGSGFAPRTYQRFLNLAARRLEEVYKVKKSGGKIPKLSVESLTPIDKPASGGLSTSGVRKALVARFGAKGVARLEADGILKIVNSATDLPAGLITDQDAAQRARGLFDPKTNTAYLIANRLNGITAPKVLLHEVGTHFGLKRMMGAEAYANLIIALEDGKDTTFKPWFDRIRANYKGRVNEGTERFAEEVLAAIAEDTSNITLSLRQSIIRAIKAFLNQFLGVQFANQVNAKEIGYLVQGSLRGLMKKNDLASVKLPRYMLMDGDVQLGTTAIAFPEYTAPTRRLTDAHKRYDIISAIDRIIPRSESVRLRRNMDGMMKVAERVGKRGYKDIDVHLPVVYQGGGITSRYAMFRNTRTGTELVIRMSDHAKDPFVAAGSFPFVSYNNGHLTDMVDLTEIDRAVKLLSEGKLDGMNGLQFQFEYSMGDGVKGVSKVHAQKYSYEDFLRFQKKKAPSAYNRIIENSQMELGSGPVIGGDGPAFSIAPNSGLSDEQKAAVNATKGGGAKRSAGEVINDGRSRWLEKLTQNWVDAYRPIRNLLGDGATRAWQMMQLSENVHGMLHTMLHSGSPKAVYRNGEFDWYEVDFSNDGLLDILKDLDGEADQFMAWMVYTRANRLMGEDREQNFTEAQIKAGLTLNQQSKDNMMTSGRDRRLVYAKAMRKMSKMQDAVLQMAIDAGVIDPEVREQLSTDFYIPFFREFTFDGETGVRGATPAHDFVNIKSVIKRLRGSELDIHDALHNMMMNWSSLMSASMKNRAGSAAMKAAVKSGAATLLTDQKLIAQIAFSKGKSKNEKFDSYVYTLEEGKKVWYEVHDPLVLNAMSHLAWGGVDSRTLQTLSTFKRWLTIGVTASPAFKIRNFIRDTVHSIAVGKLSFNFFGNAAKGYDTLKNDHLITANMMMGGSIFQFGFYNDDPAAVRRMVDAVGDSQILNNTTKARKFMGSLFGWYQDIGNQMENANRASLYMQRKEEVGHLSASFEGRDLLNFSQHGRGVAAQYLMASMPFLQARLNGLDKLARSGESGSRARLIAVVGTVTLASILLRLSYEDDEDYDSLEEWQKNTYWPLKIPGTKDFFFLPKPFEIGAIASVGERITENFVRDMGNEAFGGTNEDFLFISKYTQLRIRDILMDQLAVGWRPQIVKPVIEMWQNKNSFTGRQIENLTWKLKDTPKHLRSRAYTSEFARKSSWAMGGLLDLFGGKDSDLHISPVQVDHLIKGYFGWLGATTTGMFDVLSGGVDPSIRADEMRGLIPAGSFYQGSPAKSSKYLTLFYDQMGEISKLKAAYDAYKSRQMADEARAVVTDNLDVYRWLKSYTKVNEAFQKMNKRIGLVYDDAKMSPNAKRKEIDDLNERKVELAKKIVLIRAEREAEEGVSSKNPLGSLRSQN